MTGMKENTLIFKRIMLKAVHGLFLKKEFLNMFIFYALFKLSDSLMNKHVKLIAAKKLKDK